LRSRDQVLREQDERRGTSTCSQPGCPETATISRGTSHADAPWVCPWHYWNPGAPMREEVRRPRPEDWRKRAQDDWGDRLSAEQLDALTRGPGEARSHYVGRLLKIVRRLAERAQKNLAGLPYDKNSSLSGEM
jgi:hypothetical protein